MLSTLWAMRVVGEVISNCISIFPRRHRDQIILARCTELVQDLRIA